MSNARTGKIARAPFEIRTKVNEMLRDGAAAKAVITFLEQHEIRVDDDVVSRWRQGGYQDWLTEQSRFEKLERQREFAIELVRRGEGHLLGEGAQVLASSQLFETLSEFDLQFLKDLLREAPENYAPVVNALTKISKTNLEARKYRDTVAAAQKEIQKLRDPKQELSEDDRKAIVDKVDEILGLKK